MVAGLSLAVRAATPSEQMPDFSRISSASHPRLLVSDKEFKKLKKDIKNEKSIPLVKLNSSMMSAAKKMLKEDKEFVYKKDKGGRLLGVSRDALRRIFICSYAWRYTGKEEYLHRVERDLNAVCDFPDWNHEKFLATGEMSAAVALGYDWCYSALQDSTKAKVVDALQTKAYEHSRNQQYNWFTRAKGNHNQVCYAGLVCAAITTYEHNPQESERLITECLASNRMAMEAIYNPDGIYPEGPTYWDYGTSFEILLLTTLSHTFGTDFGLSDVPGFTKTGDYMLYEHGNTGKLFNYYDNYAKMSTCRNLWYFAHRYDRPELLFTEVRNINAGRGLSGRSRLMPLYLLYVAKYDGQPITPPAAHIHYGRGNTPVAIARTGWESGDLYLGIKGGKADYFHGHMDAGGFVFDAYGVRWALDLDHTPYAKHEAGLKPYGGDLWNKKQNSMRWDLWTYSNLQHNTLTVNGNRHIADGFTRLVEAYDEPDRIGAKVDMSDAFAGDLDKALRTALIRDYSYLEVTDSLSAPADKPAQVRWTLVTEGVPMVQKDRILLSKNGCIMSLEAKGIQVKYMEWSSDPRTYDLVSRAWEEPQEGTYLCGFTFEIPAGKSVVLTTTLKKNE